ncbi:MAG: hypothetical protein MI810_24910 [Flavobacteriales bacterium]|nr:hypothetical protein [Flavobacteriales bacterium]
MENNQLRILEVSQMGTYDYAIQHPTVTVRTANHGPQHIEIYLFVIFSTDPSIKKEDFSPSLGNPIPMKWDGSSDNLMVQNPCIVYKTEHPDAPLSKYWQMMMSLRLETEYPMVFLMLDQLIYPPTVIEDKKPRTKRGTVCIAQKMPFPDV